MHTYTTTYTFCDPCWKVGIITARKLGYQNDLPVSISYVLTEDGAGEMIEPHVCDAYTYEPRRAAVCDCDGSHLDESDLEEGE